MCVRLRPQRITACRLLRGLLQNLKCRCSFNQSKPCIAYMHVPDNHTQLNRWGVRGCMHVKHQEDDAHQHTPQQEQRHNEAVPRKLPQYLLSRMGLAMSPALETTDGSQDTTCFVQQLPNACHTWETNTHLSACLDPSRRRLNVHTGVISSTKTQHNVGCSAQHTPSRAARHGRTKGETMLDPSWISSQARTMTATNKQRYKQVHKCVRVPPGHVFLRHKDKHLWC